MSAAGDYVKSTIGEAGDHPWQAAGAALGVPGFDPAIGGTFNNRPGGALISPTGNFTSSAWNDMYQNNPDKTSSLNTFNKVNQVADVVAPIIAGGYASGSGIGSGLGSGGGGPNFGNLFSGALNQSKQISAPQVGTPTGNTASQGLGLLSILGNLRDLSNVI